jgi:uncharacterized protein (TIGR00304 family)
MSRLRLIALLLVLVGAVGVIYCVLVGEIQVGLLFFVLPYLYGGTALGALSILAVVAGVVLLFVDRVRRSVPEARESPMQGAAPTRPKSEWGGVIIVGPVPIIFGSAPRITLIALAIAAALLTAVLILFLLVR